VSDCSNYLRALEFNTLDSLSTKSGRSIKQYMYIGTLTYKFTQLSLSHEVVCAPGVVCSPHLLEMCCKAIGPEELNSACPQL